MCGSPRPPRSAFRSRSRWLPSAVRSRDLEHLPADAFISLNVSPLTAGSTELRDALAEVEGSRVVLEITESAAAEGYDKVTGCRR